MTMKLKSSLDMEVLKVKSIWNLKSAYRFNILCVGTLFRQSGLSLVLGGEDGLIRIFDLTCDRSLNSPAMTLETKGGPIQTMAIHDVTKFYHKDLAVGDSCGMMTVFSNQQILCRQSVSDVGLNGLQVEEDQTGNISIVTSDDAGRISAVLPSRELWRINLNELNVKKGPLCQVTVTCLMAVSLPDQSGTLSSYIMVADSAQNLYLLHQGSVVMATRTPAVISAMCYGKFVASNKLGVAVEQNGSSNINSSSHQVALGCTSGAIYIFYNFTVTEDEYANAQCPVTKLCSLALPDSDTDLLLCAGYFNALQVYSDGKKVTQYDTPDWINTMATADIDSDGQSEVVVGCLDSSIHAIKVSPSG